MTVRTQAHHPSAGAVIPAAGLESNFVELYDLQDGGIDGTNMNLTATFAWTGTHSFAGSVTFDTNLLAIDPTNNRIYEGATSTTTIDGLNYQHQITVLSGSTTALALIGTATGFTGVREARYHNSSSPANGDDIYTLKIYGNDSAANATEYVRLTAEITSPTDGSEGGVFGILAYGGGSITTSAAFFYDQVQVRPESLVVGNTTNIGVAGDALAFYAKSTRAQLPLAQFESTDSTANGFYLDLYKNSSSPAASDEIARIRFIGEDSGGNATNYASLRGGILDTTNGSEDGYAAINVAIAGTHTQVANFKSTAQGGIAFTEIFDITSTATTDNVCTITASSLTTGAGLRVYSNSASSSSRNLVEFINDNSSSTNCISLYLQQDSNADCVQIVNSGTGNAIQILSTSVGATLRIVTTANLDGGDVAGIYVDGSNSGTGDFVAIDLSDVGTTEFCFAIPTDNTTIATSSTNSTGRIKGKTLAGTTIYIPYFV